MQMGLFWGVHEIGVKSASISIKKTFHDFIHKAFVLADLSTNSAYYKKLQAPSDNSHKVTPASPEHYPAYAVEGLLFEFEFEAVVS
mmetsp:Transcript_14900/g.27537  ORF Transcript_14900/g.27537 Transcript_14900/m.27537 type:complete len:86 (-) Transcript_14900:114-371(-)